MRLLRTFFAAGLAAVLVATPALADDSAPFGKRGRAAQDKQGPAGRFAQRRGGKVRADQARFARGRFAERGRQQRRGPQRFGRRNGAQRGAQRGFQGQHPLAFQRPMMQRQQRMQRGQRMQRTQRMQRGQRMQRMQRGRRALAQRGSQRRGGQFHRGRQHGQMRDGRMHAGRGGMRGRGVGRHNGMGRMQGNRSARTQQGGMRGPQQAFERLDRNGDGVLDKREFAALARAQAQGRPGASRKARGQAGQRGRRQGARARPGAQRQPQADQKKRLQARSTAILYRLRQADANGDGKLSRREAPDMLKQRFAQLDKDEDGFLDKGELKRLAKGLGQKGNAGRSPERAAQKKKAQQKMAKKRKQGNKD